MPRRDRQYRGVSRPRRDRREEDFFVQRGADLRRYRCRSTGSEWCGGAKSICFPKAWVVVQVIRRLESPRSVYFFSRHCDRHRQQSSPAGPSSRSCDQEFGRNAYQESQDAQLQYPGAKIPKRSKFNKKLQGRIVNRESAGGVAGRRILSHFPCLSLISSSSSRFSRIIGDGGLRVSF